MTSPEPLLRRLRALLVWVPPGAARWISLLSLGFLLAALVSHGAQVLALAPDLQGWLWLALGVGLSLVSLIGSALLWGVVLQWLGGRPRLQPLVQAYLLSNARKYLPGGIWHLATRVQLLRQGQVTEDPLPAPLALVAVLLDPLLAAVAALALVVCGGWQGGLAPLALVPLLLLWPRWLASVLGWLERRKAGALGPDSGLEPAALGCVPALPAQPPWRAFLLAVAFVLLRFCGFACCVMALDLQPALGWGGWLAGFALAWTAGLVVPGAPAGLGVFEVVLLLRLGVALPEPPLLALVISYRLVVSLADAIAAATAAADQRRGPLAALRN
jgi:hypothetical protein